MSSKFEWRFNKLRVGDPERNPRETEFFRETPPGRELVREITQNSLDARNPDKKQVRVRFTFGAIKNGIEDYFKGLTQHLEACGLLKDDVRFCVEGLIGMRFLTIEDFGTTGLDGDTGEKARPEKSNFYDFWWREGISSKTGSLGGRWGVGKYLFHDVSKIRSLWGYTVRRGDGRELLMGKALLKAHRLNGDVYNYSGYCTDENFEPISDRQVIRDFKSKFLISRAEEPGFSVVIPAPIFTIDLDEIIRSTILEYFYPILKGGLVVEVADYTSTPGRLETLNTTNIFNIAATSTLWGDENHASAEVVELLRFAEESINVQQVRDLSVSELNITEESFGDNLEELRNSFASGSLAAFRIPVTIFPSGEEPVQSYFHVYLKRYPDLKEADEYYVRSGIRIRDIYLMGGRPVRGLFVAEHEAVAKFLGDSEPPAHSDWKARTEGFADKYKHAAATLSFIKKSMAKIASIIDRPPSGLLPDFLADIFFIPSVSKKPVVEPHPPPPPPPSRPPIFEIAQISGGFRVSLDPSLKGKIPLPMNVVIIVAYNTRRGNPLNQYDIADFDLALMTTTSIGCKIITAHENEVRIKVLRKDFELKITGFDPNRDLVVKAERER